MTNVFRIKNDAYTAADLVGNGNLIVGPDPTLAPLFASGQDGAWYEAFDLDTLFQESTGQTPVTAAGQPVGLMLDKSGNDVDAAQATSAARPTYQTSPDRITMDKVDDVLVATLPAIDGTMVLATPEGTAAYGVNISAGNYDIGGRGGDYFPGSALVGQVIRDGAMTQAEIDRTITYLRANGGGDRYGGVTGFVDFWRDWDELTEFPLINTSSGTNFDSTWRDCSSLTSFPLIDTSSGTNFFSTWRNCTSLTDFPANVFDSCPATNFDRAFLNTNLSQTSIDNILVSINTANTSNGTFGQSGGSAPSAVGEAAIDALRARGWTVTVTGGY